MKKGVMKLLGLLLSVVLMGCMSTESQEMEVRTIVVEMDSVSFDIKEISLIMGETSKLSPTVLSVDDVAESDLGGSKLKSFGGIIRNDSGIYQEKKIVDKSVDWISSDTSVATVDNTGLVTAVHPGKATICARSKVTPEKFAEVTVTVLPQEIYIDSLESFISFANDVNAGNSYQDRRVVLMCDIQLNDTATVANWSSNPPEMKWKPIGDLDTPFAGIFDGQGHTITGLYVNGIDEHYAGLFGCVSFPGEVMNITVDKSYFWGQITGGIAAFCSGTITNCHNNSTIDGGGSGKVLTYSYDIDFGTGGIVGFGKDCSVINCTNSGNVYGDGAGGIIGLQNDGIIENCLNIGNIKGSSIGGIVGGLFIAYEHGSGCEIKNCTNQGAIDGSGGYSGGIAGVFEDGTIENCVNEGSVSSSAYYVGGIAGAVGGNSVGVFSCRNEGSVSSTGVLIGGIVGYSGGDIKNCQNNGAVSGEGMYVGGIVGKVNDGYSKQVISCTNSASVTGRAVYQGQAIGGIVGLGDVLSCSNSGDVTCHYPIETEYKHVSEYTLYYVYTGGITGNGNVKESYNTGNVATIKEPLRKDLPGSPLYRYSYTGGIAASCGDEGVKNCYNLGSVTGIGVVCGINCVIDYYDGQIANCFNMGKISGEEIASGLSYVVAGISASNNAVIKNCICLDSATSKDDTDKDVYVVKTSDDFSDWATKESVLYLLNSGTSEKKWKIGESYPILHWQ